MARHETYRQEYVRCGKKGCRRCPHGPYWYAYWRESGKLRKRYVGKTFPASSPESPVAQPRDRLDDIHNPRTATLDLAVEILGFGRYGCFRDNLALYRQKCLETHPDHGGSNEAFARVNSAWSYLCVARDWN